jgi:hypothetical protein
MVRLACPSLLSHRWLRESMFFEGWIKWSDNVNQQYPSVGMETAE